MTAERVEKCRASCWRVTEVELTHSSPFRDRIVEGRARIQPRGAGLAYLAGDDFHRA